MRSVAMMGLLLVGCGTIQHPQPIALVPSTVPLTPGRYEILAGGRKTVELCGDKRSLEEGLEALRTAVSGADAFVELTIEDVDIVQFFFGLSSTKHCLRLTGTGVRLLDRPATAFPPAEIPALQSPSRSDLVPIPELETKRPAGPTPSQVPDIEDAP